jgi:hypothetical protein
MGAVIADFWASSGQRASIIAAALHIGPYELLGRIAVGGMAEVLLGWSKDSPGDGLVAIKVMLPQYAADREFLEMFLDEARLAALINHPNVVSVYDLGMEEKRLYLVSEYVRGLSTSMLLKRVLDSGARIHPRNVAGIIVQACAGLHAAHQTKDTQGRHLGLVHRDVSPQNLLLSLTGDIKVTDFGVARANFRLAETMTNVVKGKMGYMSPEQARGQKVDRRSDIFSLALVSFELLTGQRALFGETDNEIAAALAALATGSFTVDLERPEIPPRFRKVIARAMHVDPAQRYATTLEMQADLMSLLPSGLEGAKAELAQLSGKYAARLPATRSEAKQLLQPVYEMTYGSGDTANRPVRRITREKLVFYASAIAGSSLVAGLLIGSGMMMHNAAVYYRDKLGIAGVFGGPQDVPADAEGDLRIESTPNGTVEVDGRDFGETPMQIRLPAGQRLLVVRAKQDDQVVEARQLVQVPAHSLAKKKFEFADGKLWDSEELERRRENEPSPAPLPALPALPPAP